jgi:hypothetical protein
VQFYLPPRLLAAQIQFIAVRYATSFALGDMADFGRFVMTFCYDLAALRA